MWGGDKFSVGGGLDIWESIFSPSPPSGPHTLSTYTRLRRVLSLVFFFRAPFIFWSGQGPILIVRPYRERVNWLHEIAFLLLIVSPSRLPFSEGH